MRAGVTSQLPLSLVHTPSYRREDFVAGPSNAAALALIDAWPGWASPIVVLSGPSGCGKTHLAHIWAERAAATIAAAGALETDSSEGLPTLAVEDVAAGSVQELTLFHLMNDVVERGGSLLLTSRNRHEDWGVRLPDLVSRLRLATPVALDPPDDETLRRILVKLFADRQLLIERPVVDYLLTRMERSPSAAVVLVDRLDREALAGSRRITRALAAGVLAGDSAAEDRLPI
jgi:chromosomal replication initiation ATPase DnaA